MDQYTLKCACVIVLILASTCFDMSLSMVPSNSIDNAVDGNRPHQSQEKYSSMWFGPRMGKKKRAEKMNDRTKISDLLESLDDYPWTLIAFNDNMDVEKRSNTHNFTPRLGRTLDEGSPNEDLMDMSERSTSFYPRLGRGRHFTPYSPRLGRDESTVYA